MKPIIIFSLISATVLFAQNTDIASLPDAIVVPVDEVNENFQPVVEKNINTDMELLPDAIVVEVSEVKLISNPVKKRKVKKKYNKHKYKHKPKIDMASLPEAKLYDIGEENTTIVRAVLPSSHSQMVVKDHNEENSSTKIIEPKIKVVTQPKCKLYDSEEALIASTNLTSQKDSNVVDIKELNTTEVKKSLNISTVCKSEIKKEEDQKDVKKQSKPIVIVKKLEDTTYDKKEIDFWELLDKTLLHSGSLVLKKYDIAINKQNIEILKNEYYPKISMGYSGTYYHSYSKDGSASISGSYYPSYSQYQDSVGLNMKYELYRFGATDLKMEIGKKEFDIIKTELALQQEKVSKQLLQYYSQVLKAQESIKYKKRVRQLQNEILQKKYRLFHAGRIAKTQLLKDERSLVLLDKEILQHELNLGDALKNIQLLSNMELNPDEVKFLMFEPKNIPIKTFEESVQAKNLQYQIEAKRKEIELLEKDYLPTVYVDSGYRMYGADSNSFFRSMTNMRRNSWDMGMSVNWNIYDGHKVKNTITKKKLELQKIMEKKRLAKIEFESQEKRRKLLRSTLERILQTESKIVADTYEQKEVYNRLRIAGKANALQKDYIQTDLLKSELSFKLNVIEKVFETISSELIR